MITYGFLGDLYSKKIGLYYKNGNVELPYGFITPKAIGVCVGVVTCNCNYGCHHPVERNQGTIYTTQL